MASALMEDTDDLILAARKEIERLEKDASGPRIRIISLSELGNNWSPGHHLGEPPSEKAHRMRLALKQLESARSRLNEALGETNNAEGKQGTD